MNPEWILRIVLLGIAPSRQRVVGGRKWPWAVVIIFITCFGSLLYLLFHPQILNPDRS